MKRFVGILAVVLSLSPVAARAQALAPADAPATSWVSGPSRSIARRAPFEQNMTVKDEGGKVIGEMTNQMQPEVQKVTDVSNAKGDLVLKFAGNFQGNPFDAVITITPDGADKAKVLFDINGGQFSMSGTGTRTKK